MLNLNPIIFLTRVVHRVLDGVYVYDATEIFRTLPQHKKECFIKLGFYLLSFFYYLYRLVDSQLPHFLSKLTPFCRMIIALVADSE